MEYIINPNIMDKSIKAVTNSFNIKNEIINIQPFGNGHINDTYLVTTEGEEHKNYILQRKNHHVFKDIPGMMENIIRITNHIHQILVDGKVANHQDKVLTHLPTGSGEYYQVDQDGNYWTLCNAIEGCKSYEKISDPRLAYLAGKAYGEFQKQVSSLKGKPLNVTIPDFHNIEFRLNNFHKALEINFQDRKVEAQKEVGFALNLAEEMKTLLNHQRFGELPERVTHNDTKINNILFDEDDQILCVIDLDTVMPGLFHFDFGDALRTAANTAEEDEKDLSKIGFDLDIFKSFSQGILEEAKNILTNKEVGLLPHSVKFMAYIMGLRFLTDFLEGDVYYKIKHPKHNLQRTKAQFKLVEEVENQMDLMKQIIAELAGSA